MRLKVGSEVLSKSGHAWRITHIDKQSGLVELENDQGQLFHIPKTHLKTHGKKVGFFARLLRRLRK